MTVPLVSVVIPNYNYGRYLAEAIDSALAQTLPDVEVLVVDDGSKDDSLVVAGRYGDRIRVIAQANGGVSRARNRGLAESRGELVAFLDSDDSWAPHKLERQVPLFARPEVALVHCGVVHIDADGRPLREDLSGGRGKLLREHMELQQTTVLCGASTVVARRSVLEALGGFDPRLSTSADWDMWRRVMTRGEVDRVGEALARYRHHTAAMHRNIAVFESDMRQAFESVFSDPACRELAPARASLEASLFRTLAASYLYNREPLPALRLALASLQRDPWETTRYVAGFPARVVRRARARLR